MKIVISGKMGEGKTAVACVIHEALRAAGFEITKLEDLDFPLSSQRDIDNHIRNLANRPSPPKTKIEIFTRQLHRTA